MIYTEMTIKALKLACRAHEGQLDYSGIPYIFHPYQVAEQMEDEISCTVALLHDVVEDTEVTIEELRQLFPEEVTDAVQVLTHDIEEDYYDYVRKIKKNPVAVKVKLADIRHNSDETRCLGSGMPEEKLAYWRRKYQKALEILAEGEE